MMDITRTKLFLLDMDGTFYLGEDLLPGALEFLALCRRSVCFPVRPRLFFMRPRSRLQERSALEWIHVCKN